MAALLCHSLVRHTFYELYPFFMRSTINKSIKINATPANVWRVFTEPAVTRQMGGEYVSGWKAGSSFGWKGANGTMLTNGTILQIEPKHLLKHDLFDAGNKTLVTSVITYTLIEEE